MTARLRTMPKPDHHQKPTRTTRRCTPADWRCHRCSRLLGRLEDGVVHLHFARGHQYLVSLPAVATCRACNSLNKLDA